MIPALLDRLPLLLCAIVVAWCISEPKQHRMTHISPKTLRRRAYYNAVDPGDPDKFFKQIVTILVACMVAGVIGITAMGC
jgi:hypothetical protein